jgi:hypothetical protein
MSVFGHLVRKQRDGYGRLACAVITHAVKDYFGDDPLLRDEARVFFFSKSKAWAESRRHWFAQAGMSVPPEDRLRKDILTWSKHKPRDLRRLFSTGW